MRRRAVFVIGLGLIMMFVAFAGARAQYIRMIPPGRYWWGVDRVWPGYGMRRVPRPFYGGQWSGYRGCGPWRCWRVP